MTGRSLLLLLAATLLAAATAVLAGIAIAAFLGLDARAADAAPRTGTPFSWSGTLEAGKTVSVHGVNGSVNAQAATGRTISVTAKKTSRDADPERVRIVVVNHDRGVTFCVVLLDRNGRPYETCNAEGMRSRDHDWHDDDDDNIQTDFDISIPSGVDFEAHWVNGDVTAESMDSDLELESVNGDIAFSTKRVARAQTVNGSIRGSIGAATWDGTLSFESVNGDVRLQLPRATKASVRVETVSGDIQTDFPGAVVGEWGPQSFKGTIGGGGSSKLRVETVNGTVRVKTNSSS